jgi:hypothetical protein
MNNPWIFGATIVSVRVTYAELRSLDRSDEWKLLVEGQAFQRIQSRSLATVWYQRPRRFAEKEGQPRPGKGL